MRERRVLEWETVETGSEDMVLFRLRGRLTGTKESYDFLEDVRDAVRDGRINVVINAEKLERVSSPGVGVIAACFTSVMNAKGSLALTQVSKQLQTLLEIVCLWDLLGHYASEDEALGI